MRTKQPEGARHEHGNGIQNQPPAIHAALRSADFHRVRLFEPAAADGAREIYRVVAVSFSSDRSGNRMGDVSVLALKESGFAAELTVIFGGWYCRKSGPR